MKHSPFRRNLNRRRFLSAAAVAASAGFSGTLIAQNPIGDAGGVTADVGSGESTDQRLTYKSPQVQHWRIGLVLDTPVTCGNVVATFAVPMDWPEQKVKLIDQTVDPAITAWKTRDLPGGARQVVAHMARVPAGSTTEISFTFEIERARILTAGPTEDLVLPKRRRSELKVYFGDSPYIDASNGRIRAASKEIARTEAENDWTRVEQIYDYVRENVDYVEGSIKNASQALKDGQGDCEEMTSLFVALCRNARIPARMVWIPDHCYPEFYLEDSQGQGFWFPCQAAGTRQFGRMDEYRPVLQKGDRFKTPEQRMRQRYVSEFFKCDKKGKSDPRPKFIREQIEL